MRRVVASAGGILARRLGRKFVLAAFALLDLGGRIISQALDVTVAPALVSLVAGDVLVPGVVGWAAGWAMFGTLIYGVTPTVFPTTAAWIVRHPSFRAVTAVTSVSIGIVVEGMVFDGWFSGSPVSTIGQRWLLVVGIGAAIAYAAVLWYRSFTPVLSERGPLVGLFDGFARFTDVRASIRNAGLSRYEKPLLVVVALGPCLLVCAFLGILAFSVATFYPLPEIIVLLYVGVSVVDDERVRLPADTWSIQVDRRLTIGVAAATWGPKGIMCLVFIVLGILMSAFPFVVFVVVGGVLAANADGIARMRPGLWVFLAVYLLSVAILGGYGLWFWLRTIDRLPHFLDDWAERQPVDVRTEWERDERPPLVARPPGLFVPWATLFLVLIASTGTVDRDALLGVPPWHALLWVGLLVGFGWLVRRGIAAEPQPPRSEGFAIPGAALIQLTCYALLTDVAGEGLITDSLLRFQPPPAGTLPEIVAFVGLLWTLVTFYYLHDAFNRRQVTGIGYFTLELLSYPLLLVAIVYGQLAGRRLLLIVGIALLGVMLLMDLKHVLVDGEWAPRYEE